MSGGVWNGAGRSRVTDRYEQGLEYLQQRGVFLPYDRAKFTQWLDTVESPEVLVDEYPAFAGLDPDWSLPPFRPRIPIPVAVTLKPKPLATLPPVSADSVLLVAKLAKATAMNWASTFGVPLSFFLKNSVL